MLGDSAGHLVNPLDALASDCASEACRFMFTEGRTGLAPVGTSTVFSNAGYTVFRSEWMSGSPWRDATHAVFVAAYNSITHKHRDELSLLLSAGGQRWLVDSGLFTYGPNQPEVEFARSVRAHNTIAPVGVPDYPLDGTGNVEIVSFEQNGDHAWSVARHNLFGELTLERAVLWLPPDTLVVYDPAPDAGTARNRWLHFAPQVELAIDGTHIEARQPGTATWVEIEADAPPRRVSGTDPLQGVHFPKFRVKEPNETLRLNVVGGECGRLVIRVRRPSSEKLTDLGTRIKRALAGWPSVVAALEVRGCLAAPSPILPAQ